MDEKEQDQRLTAQLQADHVQKWQNRRLRVGRKNRAIKRRRWHNTVRVAVPLLVGLLSGCLYFGYLASPASRVQTVQVTPQPARNQLPQQLPVQPGDNLQVVRSKRSDLERQLQQQNDKVKRVNIQTTGTRVQIQVQLEKPLAMIEHQRVFHGLYSSGKIAHQATKRVDQRRTCVIQGIKQRSQLQLIGRQLGKLAPNVVAEIQTIHQEPSQPGMEKVRLQMRDGNQVVTFTNQLAKQLAYYPQLKPTLKQPSVLNMEFGAYATPLN
ncbi:hypothetical protein M3M35_02335 [Fructilactobacillus myrtifloralis]|uniref:Cell division protein DivIB n=1 Tax=Fructilactobacillus myrtifloralis TaxID=2940301 RepID=A0ABY5BT40_9LACO|nr:hypothetical protein [Fructilactobacillus myrtifloralis]USS85524.1 hypothetical protein M3M35_02335 [Fructilactobacillus myrtifloralis]